MSERRVTVTLNDFTLSELEELANYTNTTPSQLLRKAADDMVASPEFAALLERAKAKARDRAKG